MQRGDIRLAIDHQRLAEITKTGKSQFLGDLDDHGVRHARIARHLPQRCGAVQIGAACHPLDHAGLQRGEIGHPHLDLGPDAARVGVVHQSSCHARPRVARSISIATRMMIPVASS